MSRRVVITGIGVISPLGIGVQTFWENLLAGQVALRRISAIDPSGFASQIGAEIPAYKIGDYVPKSYRKATKVMARDIELAVVAADNAFKDAGLVSRAYSDKPTIVSERFGCNIGAGLINAQINELTYALNAAREGDHVDHARWGREGINQLTPLWLLKYLPNMLACHVTIIHGLKGPSNTITCAEASSHLAIGEAFRTIQRGKADLAICGGAETKTNHMGLIRQILLNRVTTQHNDNPAQAVRPFDVSASGCAVSEGAGLFILEELDHARQRSAKIYAEVVGFGASQDSYKVTTPQPTGHSYAAAVASALREAGASGTDIDCLVPHGLAIPLHDLAELAGLRLALGDALPRVPFAPLKGQLGNMGAGSGVDAAAAVLAVHHGKIPPAVNLQTPCDGQSLNFAPQFRDQAVGLSLSSVYSLGGQNAALVFRHI